MPDTNAVPALIPALSRPDCYPHPVDGIEVIETHISWVVLTGSYAYKIKKPVDLGFLDFSTLEARRRYCEEELRLNRRLAPELYLDVVEIRGSFAAPRIGGSGPVIEYALKMRQFPQEALGSRVLARGELTTELLSAFALDLAHFHRNMRRHGTRYGAPASVLQSALQNFSQIASLLNDAEDDEALKAVRDWTEREYVLRRSELADRHAGGFVRECHGDLHLGNIVLLGGKLVPFDCIEFNAALRWNDVMSEAAFFMMDLIDKGASRLAWHFLNAYLEATGDYEGLSVLRFYLVYRAMVRAKVHLIRARQPRLEPSESSRLMEAYRSYVKLAGRCADLRRPVLALMHGFSGCGKSTVALELVQALGAIRIRSDVERKRMRDTHTAARHAAGLPSPPLYGEGFTVATYARLARTATAVVQAGLTAIVDATFLKRWQREQFQKVAGAIGAPLVLIDVQAPGNLLRRRIASRRALGDDPSDATAGVLDYQIATAEPISDDEELNVISIDTRDLMAQPSLQDLSGRLATAS